MRERELRRYCHRLLRDLRLRPPFTVADLCLRLGEYRQRPIEVIAWPIVVPGPFGLWFSLDEYDLDVILYQEHTTPVHQNHIIVHELAHVIAGHPSDEAEEDEVAAAIRAQLGGKGPPRGRRRTCYDTDHEREAEVVATLFLKRASVADRVFPQQSEGMVGQRLDAALRDDLGWS